MDGASLGDSVLDNTKEIVRRVWKMVCERVPALKNCITDEAYEHFKEQLIEKTFINMISLSNAPVDLHLDTTDGERGQAGGWTVGRVRGR